MKRFVICTIALLVSLAVVNLAIAQDKPEDEHEKQMELMMKYGQPGIYHKYMEPMIGIWNVSTKGWDDAGILHFEMTGSTDNHWVLDGRFMVTAYEVPGFKGMSCMGYDNFQKKYTSIWIDNMSSGMFYTEGNYSEADKVFTLVGHIPDIFTGQPKTYESTIQILSNDQHIFTIHWVTADGKKNKVLEVVYTRRAQREAYLKSLEPLVGTWQGHGEMEGVGNYTDKLVFKWSLNKNFMESNYEMMCDGKLVWQDFSIWGWDVEKNHPYWVTYGMDGSIGKAKSFTYPQANTLVIEGVTSGGDMREWRTTSKYIDDNTMFFTMEIKKDGAYVKFIENTYKKQQ